MVDAEKAKARLRYAVRKYGASYTFKHKTLDHTLDLECYAVGVVDHDGLRHGVLVSNESVDHVYNWLADYLASRPKTVNDWRKR